MAGGVRAVAGVYVVLGLAVAWFALFAISLDPTTLQQLQLQMIKESGHQPELGQTDSAVTAERAMQIRADAVLLLLGCVAMALTAMAAVAGSSRCVIFFAQILSFYVALGFATVLSGVLDLAVGRCHGHGIYPHVGLVYSYVIVAVSFSLLFIVGFLGALFGED